MREEDLKGVNRDLKAKDCQTKKTKTKNENLQKKVKMRSHLEFLGQARERTLKTKEK
jgi:hypothetical protein